MKCVHEWRRAEELFATTKHPATFARREMWIIEVMKDHRHENQVNRIVRGRNRFATASLVSNSVIRVASCLVQHFFRGVNADNLRVKTSCQTLGKASRATTEVQDRFDPLIFHVRRDNIHPEI
jgi:hypothetical protein